MLRLHTRDTYEGGSSHVDCSEISVIKVKAVASAEKNVCPDGNESPVSYSNKTFASLSASNGRGEK